MSTDWNNYNQFMGAWTGKDSGNDADIEAMIEEHNLFKSLTDFEYEQAVNDEFDHLVKIARDVEAEQIGASTASITADGCALAAVFSFGMSMAGFVVAEALAISLTLAAASEQSDLTNEMKTADVDIANKIGSESSIAKWIKIYKKNNIIIVSYCGQDQPPREARNILFQFMTIMEARGVELTVDNFHKYAESCRILWDSDTKYIVSDALDKFNLSAGSPQDVADCLSALHKYGKLFIVGESVKITFLFGAMIYLRQTLNVAEAVVRQGANIAIIGEESLFAGAEKVGTIVARGCGKYVLAATGIIAVLDLFLNVYEIVDAVKQANAIITKINDHMRPGYHEYYKNIKESAIEYNKSVTQAMPVYIDIISNDSWDSWKSLKVKLSDTVATVKNKMIDDRKNFPEIDGGDVNYRWLVLIFNGYEIEDDRTLFSYNIKNKSSYNTRGEYTISYWYGYDPSRG